MSKNSDTGGKPIAAIWWRQSSKDQSASDETQINEARALLKSEGYEVGYILGQDWHSLSILDAPKMQELLSLVRHAKIKAIGMYHGDRLAGNPAQKALILDLCERHGVKLLAKHSPIQEGPEGELIEYVRTWGKEQSVLRTQQASRDGLRDRVMIKGLPVNGKAPYGYKYDYRLIEVNGKPKQIPVALIPDPPTYPVVCNIWRMALKGATLRSICQSLYDDGIRTTRGNRGWDASDIFPGNYDY